MFLALILGCIPVLTSVGGGEEAGSTACGDTVENAWPSATPPGGLGQGGFSEGDTLADACMLDQHEQSVALRQFYGHPMVVDISTMWCGPCRELAVTVDATAASHEGLVYVTLLPEDLDAEPPTVEELNQWGDAFEITQPILADDAGYSYNIAADGTFPQLLVVDADLTVFQKVDPPTEAGLEAALSALLE